MPKYEYKCTTCGAIQVLRNMSISAKEVECGYCPDGVAKRNPINKIGFIPCDGMYSKDSEGGND